MVQLKKKRSETFRPSPRYTETLRRTSFVCRSKKDTREGGRGTGYINAATQLANPSFKPMTRPG